MSTNSDILNKGFSYAQEAIRQAMRDKCYEAASVIIEHAIDNKEWRSFTGNTVTSYAFGCYENGALFEIFISGDEMKSPIRAKVEKGEVLFLQNPYEGKARAIKGRVDITNKFGYDFSFSFLQRYKTRKKGYSIVITTGTEYSEYLEIVYELNTLTDTYEAVKSGLVDNILRKKVL